MKQNFKEQIPEYVTHVTKTIQNAGFEAFLVGGCVRDIIIGREPKDWDITTSANPEQIQSLFEKTVYENKFGTVAVMIPKEETVSPAGHRLALSGGPETSYFTVEVTPFRLETSYTDHRHPDLVTFSDNLEDDLQRRDFTVNAIAYDPIKDILKDIFGGIKDIQEKVLRTVGEPNERFEEDALRLMRAVRFSVELGFVISSETLEAVAKNSDSIQKISTERIRDEFRKIIMSPEPALGVGMLQKLGLLKHFIPELEQGIGCEQGGAHKYDVYEHLLQALQHAADKNWPLEIRLSALFHDIGKPKTRRKGIKKAYTFYGHEVVGARMARVIMERMKFPKDTTELVTSLVRYHMFFSDTEQITLSAVRRVVRNVSSSAKATQDKGVENEHNIWKLMKVRECDRVGMAKVEAPYRLRKYHAMIEQVLRDPISVSQLVVDGNILMKELDVKAGPRMGWILNSLLEEVLDDPEKNTREYLDKRVGELNELSDEELKKLGEKAKQTKDEAEEKEVVDLHKKHNVRK